MTEKRIPSSPMNFESLALFTADYAAVENSKVYASGGFWNTLQLPSFPQQVSFSLVAVVQVPARAYLEDHRVTIEMVNADEERLPLRIDGELRVGASPHLNPGDPTVVSMAFPLNGLTLERAGDYWFVLSVNGNELNRYRIRAVQSVPIPQQLPFDAPDDGEDEEE